MILSMSSYCLRRNLVFANDGMCSLSGGSLAMKMVCAAGLVLGTEAGPEAEANGDILLKSAGA